MKANGICALFMTLAAFTGLCSPASYCETTTSAPTTLPTISVQKFKGPEDISVDSDLGYKVKSGDFENPYKDDFENLGTALQKAFVIELQSKLGQSAVIAASTSVDDANKTASSKYVLKGVIDKVRFEGKTLIPNYYELTLTAQLVSTSDNRPVWRVHHKLFAHMYKTRKSETPAETFEKRMAPHVADKIGRDIAAEANN